MVQSYQLQLGNLLFNKERNSELCEVCSLHRYGTSSIEVSEHDSGYVYTTQIDHLDPIPLTQEILLKMGFVLIKTAIITRTMQISLGRDRYLSVACAGTPNEAVYISEEEAPVVKDIICLRNYDYDGKTYVHDIQNLYQDITKKPLIFPL